MQKFFYFLQFFLLIFLVYFGAQENSPISHIALGITTLVISLICCILGAVNKGKSPYNFIVFGIVVLSAFLGHLVREDIISAGAGDYLTLFSQFAIIFSSFLLFDFSKLPNSLADSKLVKVSTMILAWQVLSGVLLRGQNKAIARAGDDPSYMFYFIHAALAVVAFVVTFSLAFFLIQQVHQIFKKFGITLVSLLVLQVVLGVIAMIAAFRPSDWHNAYNFIRPLHFVNSALILSIVFLLKKGTKEV